MNFITPKQVAIQLGCSEETVRSWCRSGDLPAYKVRGRFKIPQDQFTSWLANQQITTEPKEKPTQAFDNLPGLNP